MLKAEGRRRDLLSERLKSEDLRREVEGLSAIALDARIAFWEDLAC